MDGSTRDNSDRVSTDGAYHRILLYDNGTHDSKILAWAAGLAAEHGASLTVAEVVPRGILGAIDRVDAFCGGRGGAADRAGRKRRLTRWLADEAPVGLAVIPAVFEGCPAAEIVRVVSSGRYDLVVVAGEDRTSLRGLIDTTTVRLARECPCPVLVVKPRTVGNIQRIAAAIGCGEAGQPLGAIDDEILTAALNLARTRGRALDVVRPWEFGGADFEAGRSELPPPMYREFYERHHRARADGIRRLLRRLEIDGDGITVHLPHDTPASAVVRFVRENAIDLLVIGRADEGATATPTVDPVLESVIGRVSCAVMVIKPPGFICPVAEKRERRRLGPVLAPVLQGAEMRSESFSKRTR